MSFFPPVTHSHNIYSTPVRSWSPYSWNKFSSLEDSQYEKTVPPEQNPFPYLPFPWPGWWFDLVSVGDSWWENVQRKEETPCQYVRHSRGVWKQEEILPLAPGRERVHFSGGHQAWVMLLRTSLWDIPQASVSVWNFSVFQIVKGWSTGPVCRWTAVRNLVSKTWEDCNSSSAPLCVQQTWEVHWSQAKALAEWGCHILTMFCMRKMRQWK